MKATMQSKDKRTTIDANLIVSKQFADVFQAYLECSDDIQAAIREMVQVMNAPDVTDDEYDAALATIAEALFPSKHNGALGIDLEECSEAVPGDINAILQQMEREEAGFSDRLNALLQARGMTQAELAAQIGVGQPAISMMLARGCRPQRRTIEKVAQALRVAPKELWPGFKED